MFCVFEAKYWNILPLESRNKPFTNVFNMVEVPFLKSTIFKQFLISVVLRDSYGNFMIG